MHLTCCGNIDRLPMIHISNNDLKRKDLGPEDPALV